jgi:hypothetical protein
MKKRIFSSILISFILLIANPAHAFFFFFIPGSVTGAISDAITGSEGANCVGSRAKVGDSIRLNSGSIMTVKSLSGTSTRCIQSEFPIRALLEPISNTSASISSTNRDTTAFKSNAGIELPIGWAVGNLNDDLKSKHYIFYALNRTIDAGLVLGAVKRDAITAMLEFAKARRTSQMAALNDAVSTEITQVDINGFAAWRFEVTGKNQKTGKEFTYGTTLVESEREVVEIRTFMFAASYDNYRDQLNNLALGIRGIETSVVAAVSKEPTTILEQRNIQNNVKVIIPNVLASISARLAELNELYKDGLITKLDFEAKKQEILKGL